MVPHELIPILLFVCITAAVMALASLFAPSRDRVAERVRSLSGNDTPKADAGLVGRLVRRSLSQTDAQKEDRLGLRLTHAGYDARRAVLVFRTVRLILILVPVAGAAGVIATGVLSRETGAIAGAILAGLGTIAPGMWLDSRKKKYQNELRRGLPDFFDVIVLCVEGGMSLPAAWRRVADELRRAYPTLWKELKLVEQEEEIGRPMSEALQRCAERTDLDEVLSLASVVRQAERIVQDFEVRRAGQLIYRDRFRWDGPWDARHADWYFGGYLSTASLFVGGPLPDTLPAADPTVRRSVFPLDTGASCVRWCGPPTAVTADLVRVAFRIAANWTGGDSAAPWFSSSDLVPNHWFSTTRG